ncbi:MAG: Bax inhibitor-1/YccA family protein [Thermodesulfobacteriota bacterium]
MALKTSNPVFGEKTWGQVAGTAAIGETMTVQGAINRAIALLGLVVIGSAWTWFAFLRDPASASLWMIIGLIGGLIACLVTVFKMEWAPVTAPIYAVLEGLAIGGISASLERLYPGIVIQAVGLTFGTCFVMLLAYTSGVVKPTERFRAGVIAATGAVFLVYLISLVLGIFGLRVPYIHDSGIIGIGFSLVVVCIAALNLVLDFDLIDTGARRQMPRYMEWYAAFALMVTLIWLYIEIINLLSKLRR